MIPAKPFSISKWTIYDAWLQVKANGGSAGIDGQTIKGFEQDLKKNLYKIWNRMSSGSYFPPNVKQVEIPKDNGTRILGIPTVADRIAQTVVKMELEPDLEAIFDDDSYGYRPRRSAHDALAVTRKRCWRRDWVIDLDVKGFFDNLNWALLDKALRKHTSNPWVLLYIERWLKAPMETMEGTIKERHKGTPQGGVISPLIANLFLHYVFDKWIRKHYPQVQFARYADDVVVHCHTEKEAIHLKQCIEQRFKDCFLECHPQKTKLVYCKDVDRQQDYPLISFDFLGYCFRPRQVRSKHGKRFVSFTPAISQKAQKRVRDKLRSFGIRKRIELTLPELAKKLNPVLYGWINYYGRFRKSELVRLFEPLNLALLKWAKQKYKRFNDSYKQARRWLSKVANYCPSLFAHWQLGYKP